MTHPTERELLQHALDPARDDRGVAEHIAECAGCGGEVARIRSDVALLRGHVTTGGEQTPVCLDEESVAALASGALMPGGRAPLVAHVATCAYCRGRVTAVARALTDPAVEGELAALDAEVEQPQEDGRGRGSPPDRRPRRTARTILIPLAAAAAVLLLVVVPRTDSGVGAPHRGPTITRGQAPEPTAPSGVVAGAERLRWATVSGADRYRVILFDAGGAVLFETQLADTVATLPDSVALAAGRSYLWKVEARTGWGRWESSELVEFSIGVPDRARRP